MMAGAEVSVPEIESSEAELITEDLMPPSVRFAADVQAGEGASDVPVRAIEGDVALWTDAAHDPVGRITRRSQRRQGAHRALVALRGRALAETLVRAEVVILVLPTAQSLALGGGGVRRWRGRRRL